MNMELSKFEATFRKVLKQSSPEHNDEFPKDKGRWGVELDLSDQDSYDLESTTAQGTINLRWPYSRDVGMRSLVPYKTSWVVTDETLYQIVLIAKFKLVGLCHGECAIESKFSLFPSHLYSLLRRRDSHEIF